MGERDYEHAVRARFADRPAIDQPFSWALGVREPIDPSVGTGYRDLIRLSGNIYIVMSDFCVRQDTVNRIRGEDLFKFNWQISGHSISQFSNRTKIEVRGPTLAYLCQPAGIDEEERYVGGSSETSVTISVTRDLLLKTLNLDPADAPKAVRAYSDGVRPSFAVQWFALPPRLRATLQEILRPPPLGSLYNLYLQARVYDLLWLTLNHLKALETPAPSRIKLTARDKECINEVRLLLDRKVQSCTSMTELCRHFGINRNKMNYGFKLLFGTSPMNYLLMARLDLARRRLCNTDRPIAVIAQEIGYQQQSTFSSAFKRYFGISPRDMRR